MRAYSVFTNFDLNILEGCRRGLSDLIRWLHFNLGEGTEKPMKSRSAGRPEMGSGGVKVLRSSWNLGSVWKSAVLVTGRSCA